MCRSLDVATASWPARFPIAGDAGGEPVASLRELLCGRISANAWPLWELLLVVASSRKLARAS